MNRFTVICKKIFEPEWCFGRTEAKASMLDPLKVYHATNFFRVKLHPAEPVRYIIHLKEYPDKFFHASLKFQYCIDEWCSMYEDEEEARHDFKAEGGAEVIAYHDALTVVIDK